MSRLSEECGQLLREEEEIQARLERLQSFRENIVDHFDEVDAEFERMTSLKKEDYFYVVLCTALQCLRQYLVTDFKPRLSDKEAAKKVKEDYYEASMRRRVDDKYKMSVAQIWLNPVPFDAIAGGKRLGAGVSGTRHRFNCPGHDPVLGYLFGTVNIMTGTITVIDGGLAKNLRPGTPSVESAIGLNNYLVESIPRTYKSGILTPKAVDQIAEKADPFSTLVDAVVNRIKEDREDGLLALSQAVIKEHVHLKSDRISTQSLPIPGLSIMSPDLAEKAASIGFDSLNLRTVGKQAAYSFLVNSIIRILYWLHHQIAGDYSDAHRIRIARILDVSNALSTVSNVAVSLLGAIWNPALLKKLDVGGSAVTFATLYKNADFIYRMQVEYIEKQLLEQIEII